MSDHCAFDLCDGDGLLYDPETNTAYPCRCRPLGIWPAFQNAAKVVKCMRCEALALHDAHRAIVQTPHASKVQHQPAAGDGAQQDK